MAYSTVVRLLSFLTIHIIFTDAFVTNLHSPRPSFVTQHRMGIFDSISNFLKNREGDFVKLKETEVFGPGPALILYKVPPEIDDEEIQDMLSDGSPQAFRKGVKIVRISNIESEDLFNQSLEDFLQRVVNGEIRDGDEIFSTGDGRCPVLFFSGFDNLEMMGAYNILGREIYEESGESAACAKAMPNAMKKKLGQLLEEISGDHKEAMAMDDSI